MAHDHPSAGHSYFPDLPSALSPAAHLESHQAHPSSRQGIAWRRVAVRRIGYGTGCHHRNRQHYRCGHGGGARRTGGRAVVLADRTVRHLDEVCRGTAGGEISREKREREGVWRTDVRLGTRTGMEKDGCAVCRVHGRGCLRYRQHRAGQRHCHAYERDL